MSGHGNSPSLTLRVCRRFRGPSPAGLASAPFPHGARTRPISLRLRLRPPEVLDALEPALPPLEGLVPAPAFACRLRGERPARPRAHVLSQVHEGQVRGARVPNVAGPRRL